MVRFDSGRLLMKDVQRGWALAIQNGKGELHLSRGGSGKVCVYLTREDARQVKRQYTTSNLKVVLVEVLTKIVGVE